MASIAKGIFSGAIAFISYGVLPAGGNKIAEHFGVHITFFDAQLLLELGALTALLVFLEKAFEKTKPVISGFSGFMKALVSLWYFLSFLAMIRLLEIASVGIKISINYLLIKDLTIASIGLYALKNLYLLIFGKWIRGQT